MRFPIAVHADNHVAYGVTVPDLPGCFSAGNALEQAVENAKKAIDGHVELLQESGREVPLPSTVAPHADNPDFAGAVRVNVDVPIELIEGGTRPSSAT